MQGISKHKEDYLLNSSARELLQINPYFKLLWNATICSQHSGNNNSILIKFQYDLKLWTKVHI